MKTKAGNKKVNKAWLHDHINDPYVKLATREGYRARAAYKLKEIDETLGLIKPGYLVVDLGCTRAQGFLFAGPRPPAEIEQMIQTGVCPPMVDLDSGDTVETAALRVLRPAAGFDGPAAPTTAARRFHPPGGG